MVELIKSMFFTGIGLAAMTKEKAEELAKEFAKSAELSGQKGKEFVDEVVTRSEKARRELEDTVQRFVGRNIERMNVATHEDIARLAARIEQLERMLAEKSA